MAVIDPITFDPWPYTPAILRCPSEEEPAEAHSYFLNFFPMRYGAKAGNLREPGLSSSAVILAGEKYGVKRDFFLQDNDFLAVVDPFHHGLRNHSNYLYLDGHVQPTTLEEAGRAVNPWTIQPLD